MSRGTVSTSAVLETQAFTESNRHGMNVLVEKVTAHARLKEIRAKATVIALANFDVGREGKKDELDKSKV